MTHRDQCLTVANRTGWEVADAPLGITMFRKGERWVQVRFSERGTVVTGATPRRAIAGTDKLEKVLLALGG